MAAINDSLYDRMCLEIQAFLPGARQEELAEADIDSLCCLLARARVVEELWRDIFAAALGEVLGDKK